VICTVETQAELQSKEDVNFRVVARLRHADGRIEDVRHDGREFYRDVCATEEGQTRFPGWMVEEKYLRNAYLKLMDDERRSALEYSDLTWPNKEGLGQPRKYVSFLDVLGFELLDQTDVARVEGEVTRLTEALTISQGRIWVRCGEPCYRLWDQRNNELATELTFADQNEAIAVDEILISATNPERLGEEWARVADAADHRNGYAAGSIEILDSTLFVTDFDDVGFVKFADMIARGIAYYFATDYWGEDGQALMASSPDDVDLWNALRRSVTRMKENGTAAEEDDDTVMRASSLWLRLGGAIHRPRYIDPRKVELWSSSTIANWLEREIKFDSIITPPPAYSPKLP
jgi:hypothetical protein